MFFFVWGGCRARPPTPPSRGRTLNLSLTLLVLATLVLTSFVTGFALPANGSDEPQTIRTQLAGKVERIAGKVRQYKTQRPKS